jgi:hypothetical protein
VFLSFSLQFSCFILPEIWLWFIELIMWQLQFMMGHGAAGLAYTESNSSFPSRQRERKLAAYLQRMGKINLVFSLLFDIPRIHNHVIPVQA